jgi:hypothetical protein
MLTIKSIQKYFDKLFRIKQGTKNKLARYAIEFRIILSKRTLNPGRSITYMGFSIFAALNPVNYTDAKLAF